MSQVKRLRLARWTGVGTLRRALGLLGMTATSLVFGLVIWGTVVSSRYVCLSANLEVSRFPAAVRFTNDYIQELLQTSGRMKGVELALA